MRVNDIAPRALVAFSFVDYDASSPPPPFSL